MRQHCLTIWHQQQALGQGSEPLPYHGFVVVDEKEGRFGQRWCQPAVATVAPLQGGGHIGNARGKGGVWVVLEA
eukprot:1161875-Pelagomonas_calceolata.AAC.7